MIDDELRQQVGGYDTAAVSQVRDEGNPPYSERLRLALVPDPLKTQSGQMEMLRNQHQLGEHSLSAGYLLWHLEALAMIGQYNSEAVGEQRMIVDADGVSQLDHRNFYDDVLVGQADVAKTAEYLVDHFQYVCRLGISWHYPDLRASWEAKKKILERILEAKNASHDQYMQDKVKYKETSPDLAVSAPSSTRLKEVRDRQMYIEFAMEIRQIIAEMIAEIKANPN